MPPDMPPDMPPAMPAHDLRDPYALPSRRGGLRHLVQARRTLRADHDTKPEPGLAPEAAWHGGVALLGASATALTLAAHLHGRGHPVTMIEADPDAAARLSDHLRRLGAGVVVSDNDALVAGAGLVIETSGSGDAGARLERVMTAASANAVLAVLTNSASTLTGPARLVALRLVAPSSGLIEVLGRDGCDPDQQRNAARLALRLGCLPVCVPARSEGAGARLLARLEATAEALIFAGAAPWDMDAAAEGTGFAQGPCALMDRLGVDSALPRRARLMAAGMDLPDPGVITRMVAEGRLGRRASVGWFRYPGGGGQVTDPLIEDLVREEAWFARRTSREFDTNILARHLLAALIDESARLMDEGAVRHFHEMDLIAAVALGFPKGLGGPLWLADHWGGPATLAAVEALRADLSGLPGVPAPAPVLHRAASRGQTLTATLAQA